MNIDLQLPFNDEQSERLLHFCLSSGVDSFSARFACFAEDKQRMEEAFERFVPFSLGLRSVERTVVYSFESSLAPVECWSFNHDTITLILDTCGGSFPIYQMGRFFAEDWTFYRNGEFLLGFVSHEDEAFLRLSDNEWEQFKLLDLPHVLGK